MKISLGGKDCAGECPGDQDDQLRAEADFVDLLHHEAWADLPVKNPTDRLGREQREVAEVAGKGENQLSDVAGRRHGRESYGWMGWVAEGELATL